MSKVRVLEIITGLGPGGAERLVLDMASRLDAERFDVRLVTILNDLRGLKVYGHEDFPVTTIDCSGAAAMIGAFRLHSLVRTFRPHVVHAHMFHSLVAALVATRIQRHSPSVCFTSHRSKYSPVRTWIVRRLRALRDVDVVFEEGQHPELNAPTTTVIANGVPVPPSPPVRAPWKPSGPIKFLFVGRLSPPKDPLGLLHSFAAAGMPGATLDVVGAGSLDDAARLLTQELGLGGKVRFHGIRSDVRSMMRSADVFLMHSQTEGMPMALLEAGAEAMPVLATPVGSIPRLLEADRGWLADPAAFPAALRAVAADPVRALGFGARLHSHVRAYHSLESVVDDHAALYEALANRRIADLGIDAR